MLPENIGSKPQIEEKIQRRKHQIVSGGGKGTDGKSKKYLRPNNR